MNKKIAFLVTASIILLIAQTHRISAADTSDELFDAVKSGETAEVGRLLAAGADPNARIRVGLTPLISAALSGRTDIAALLLAKGADVNGKSDSGMTALMLAAAEGHKGVAQLLLDNGADANIMDTSGRTAFRIASLMRHEEVAALLQQRTLNTQDTLSAIFAVKKHFIFTIVYPCLFAAMALFFLVIGLRGVLTKKPFLISGRWLLALVLLGFTPAILQAVTLRTSGDGSGVFMAVRWLIPAVSIIVLIFLSFTMRGYVAFGVSDTSFREGLLASLKKMNLPHEETLSVLQLPTIGADLQVAVQSWMGTAQMKMKQRQFRKVLGDIAGNMNDYYHNSSVSKINLTSCMFYVVMGVLLIVFAGVFLFAFSRVL